MNMVSNCPFCQIVSGQVKTPLLYQDDLITAFKDIHPITPVHILIIPNRHIESVNDLTSVDELTLGKLITTAQKIASEQGIAQSGYRLVINTGSDAGQSVYHLHLHLIGGRRMPFHFKQADSIGQ